MCELSRATHFLVNTLGTYSSLRSNIIHEIARVKLYFSVDLKAIHLWHKILSLPPLGTFRVLLKIQDIYLIYFSHSRKKSISVFFLKVLNSLTQMGDKFEIRIGYSPGNINLSITQSRVTQHGTDS